MIEWAPALMFLALLVLIFCGYPVAFCLAGVALIFAFLGIELGWAFLNWPYMMGVYNDVFEKVLKNDLLLAVPFFVFMGTMLEKSRLAEDLLHTVGQLFGPVRGGLGFAVIFVGALLAAATGVIGASVVAMGMISLPVMLRYGYRKELATGVIAASGTLGQIIPPSLVLVVLADQIDDAKLDVLFRAALLPGLGLAALYAAYVAGVSWWKRDAAPALPASERQLDRVALLKRVALVMVPPLALIVLVLGSIFVGLASPTEAGALGATGAIVLTLISRRFSLQALRATMLATAKLSCMVMFLLIGSRAFTIVFRGLDGDLWIQESLTSLPGGAIGALLVANLLIFALGFFIDFFEIAFIVVPLLWPVFDNVYGMDPSVFAIMVALNMQTSFLTPPFGFALFYLKGVCPPEIRTSHIYRGVVPFIVLQLIALITVIAYPQIVLWWAE